MLIVLEGCDGTGKTTLATFLSQLLDAEIIHCSTHTPNDYVFFSKIIDMSRTRNIIADRFCYGQFVYQKEEDRPLKHEKTLMKLEEEMLHFQAKVILVTATTEKIKERLGARDETLINGLTVEEVQERFKKLKKNSLLTWLEYNT